LLRDLISTSAIAEMGTHKGDSMPLLKNAVRITAGALAAGIVLVTLAAGSAGADTVIRKPQSVVDTPDSNVIRKPQ
jgi:hypothetical protein